MGKKILFPINNKKTVWGVIMPQIAGRILEKTFYIVKKGDESEINSWAGKLPEFAPRHWRGAELKAKCVKKIHGSGVSYMEILQLPSGVRLIHGSSADAYDEDGKLLFNSNTYNDPKWIEFEIEDILWIKEDPGRYMTFWAILK